MTSVRPTGPFRVPTAWARADQALARANAQRALAAIDWSRRDIVINVPGTGAGNRAIPAAMVQAVAAVWPARDMSLVAVAYPASVDFGESLAKGVATLKLVLAGIAAHGGSHRVLAFGHSQGALVIGHVMAEASTVRKPDRAVLFGHPWAASHHFDHDRDPRVLEVNYLDDHITMPLAGSLSAALEGAHRITRGDPAGLPAVFDLVTRNPDWSLRFAGWSLREVTMPKSPFIDPHNYDIEFERGIRFLRTGQVTATGYPMVSAIARRAHELRKRGVIAAASPARLRPPAQPL